MPETEPVAEPEIWVDLNKGGWFDVLAGGFTGGRTLFLSALRTQHDLAAAGITLTPGMRLRVYADDATEDEDGRSDDLVGIGTVGFSLERQQWYVNVELSPRRG